MHSQISIAIRACVSDTNNTSLHTNATKNNCSVI